MHETYMTFVQIQMNAVFNIKEKKKKSRRYLKYRI